MKDNQLIVYGIGGLFGLWVLYHTWPFILGGLALMGLWCLLQPGGNRGKRKGPLAAYRIVGPIVLTSRGKPISK